MKILVTDDHALFRDGMRFLLAQLQDDIEVLDARSCEEAEAIAHRQNDLALILLDLAMRDVEGVAAVRRLRARAPSVPVVVISATEAPTVIQEAFRCGASGFIPKSSTGEVMLQALRLVLSGGIYIPPALAESDPSVLVAGDKAPNGRGDARYPPDGAQRLTLRQLEVLSLIGKGESNKLIGRHLNLTEGTVKIHVTAIMKALNTGNRTQAVLKAQALGLLKAQDR